MLYEIHIHENCSRDILSYIFSPGPSSEETEQPKTKLCKSLTDRIVYIYKVNAYFYGFLIWFNVFSLRL